jgi:hypothetical protein
MTRQISHAITALILVLTGCQINGSTSDIKMETVIDKIKRDQLVKKYDLLKFPNIKQPVLLTIDEFFDGNNDESSIATNLVIKVPMIAYYNILKGLADNPKTVDAFAELKDVIIYDNGQLNDNEWFYTDVIYFIGDLTKEEIKEATKNLFPDEVEYDTENRIKGLSEKYKDKNVVYVWWD